MNLQNIGHFLSKLRKEKGWTQEQLGEQLGVSNKTVSRWETGTYLPPVEMLQELSKLYGITINELLSGDYLKETDYQQKAEENIKEVLSVGFSIKDKIRFYKDKWRKDHRSSLITMIICFAFLYLLGFEDDSQLLNMVTTLGVFAFCIMRYNAMMIYVEGRAFDPVCEEGDKRSSEKTDIIWAHVRITGLIILGISTWICADLVGNFLYAIVPELNDGITIRGFWSGLFFGTDGILWTRENYFNGMMNAINAVTLLFMGNILLFCLERSNRFR